MRNTKTQAFTLVELIVVITILAILGTIAFISLQGYSADARNSKRTSDLGNIQSAISLKQVEGVSLMSFVASNDNKIASISLAWSGTFADETKYNAWIPAYTVLNVFAKDFKDPNDKEYRIGSTTLKGWTFQVAATIEVDGTDTALVNGTYVQRTQANSGSIVATGNDVVTIEDALTNYFKAGDIIDISGGAATIIDATVKKVSRDGVTITLDTNVAAWTGTLSLNADETTGLIGATIGITGEAVVNLDIDNLAY